MNCTAIAPSPTLEATRLMEPCRTSPAAKMPGTLVSRKKGSRSSGQRFGGCPSCIKSGPVRTKPFSSPSTTPLSQLVCGSVPMKMNSEVAGSVFSSCVLSLTIMMLALHSHNAGAGLDLDIVRVLNPVDEIFGHVFCERIVAHQHRHMKSVLR